MKTWHLVVKSKMRREEERTAKIAPVFVTNFEMYVLESLDRKYEKTLKSQKSKNENDSACTQAPLHMIASLALNHLDS
jgi:hypothetical protein